MTNELTAHFVSKLWLEDIDGERSIIASPLVFFSAELRGIVVVPAGFVTDFASIPRWVWSVIPKRGKHDWAAVLQCILDRCDMIDQDYFEGRLVRFPPREASFSAFRLL